MSLSRKARSLVEQARRHGLRSAAHLMVSQPLENGGLLRVGYCLALDIRQPLVDPAVEAAGIEVRELRPEEIDALASSKADWFFPQAVQESLERGDRCFGVLIDGVVACSNWCTSAPLMQFDLLLEPPPGAFFGHRLFTKPEFRGRRLQALLREYVMCYHRAQGYHWYINTMYWTNTASLHAARRLGYKRVGTIITIGPSAWGLNGLYAVREPRVRIA